VGAWSRPPPRSGATALWQLDLLRGVAVLAVFLQHLGDRFAPFIEASLERALPPSAAPLALTAFHHAWWGVDLFFVLSGFTLALGYLRGFERGAAVPARVFWRRRATRILPAFWVALAVTLAAHRELLCDPRLPRALAAHALLLQGYDAPGAIVLIGAAWSLTTECHFYLVLPAIARPLLDPARPLARRLGFGILLCLGAWLLRDFLHRLVLEPGARTFGIELTQRRLAPCRVDQFVLGALAAGAHRALLRSERARAARRLAPVAALASAAALLASFRPEGALFLEPGGSWPYALMSLSTAALVLAISLWDLPSLLARALAPVHAIGVVSYGVFLYHQLALGVVGARFPPAMGDPDAARLAWTAAAGLALSALAGLASYRWIELPLLRRGEAPRAEAP
jgi:peptidoglycan/LPS O-acetylase OafA/YrhL